MRQPPSLPPLLSRLVALAVPRDRPGLGVAVDRERIEALTVRRSELRPT